MLEKIKNFFNKLVKEPNFCEDCVYCKLNDDYEEYVDRLNFAKCLASVKSYKQDPNAEFPSSCKHLTWNYVQKRIYEYFFCSSERYGKHCENFEKKSENTLDND